MSTDTLTLLKDFLPFDQSQGRQPAQPNTVQNVDPVPSRAGEENLLIVPQECGIPEHNERRTPDFTFLSSNHKPLGVLAMAFF